METRFKCLNANTESAALARIAARTIIKGITNHVGIDVIATDTDLSRLYESANLSNKLYSFYYVLRQMNLVYSSHI